MNSDSVPRGDDGIVSSTDAIAHTSRASDTVHSSNDPSNTSQPTKRRKVEHHPSGSNSKSQKKNDKWKRDGKKRRGTRSEIQNSTNDVADGGETADKASRLPKRRCALLIGFCGSGYYGMQIQPDVRTIEGELFSALVKAGAVSQDNADDPVKVGLLRAARTDAGVHAAGNLVSIKMITDVPGVPDMLARINEELPPEIRLWRFLRVQGSFNARMSCDSRKYTYFFPSYLLIPPKPDSNLLRSFIANSTASDPSSSHANGLASSSDGFWKTSATGSRAEDMLRKKKWRVGSEMVESLRELAKKFEGTHNFHNFTVGRDAKDASCYRYMKRIEIAEPAVYGETEWISVMFHGQSFMLHQRKMMFILVLSCRTGTPPGIIDELYSPRSVSIPKMPSLGLLLEYPIFDSYNSKVTKANAGLVGTDAEYRLPIDFEVHREEIEKFKQEWIYSRMRTSEDKLEIFDRWIHTIDAYPGVDLSYLNTRSVIPDVAVYKRGQKRAGAFQERKRFDVTVIPEEGPELVRLKESLEREVNDVGGGAPEEVEPEEGEGLGKAELVEMEG